MNNLEAIVLAGGFGTRLRSVVNDLPKPMAIVDGKHFLEYILDDLNVQGFKRVVLAVGYKKESVIDFFKNKYKNLEIVYSIEDEPLGTGGAIMQAMNYINSNKFFVINGDTMFRINLLNMYNLKSPAIACKKMYDFSRYGEVKINDDIITSFNEKKYVKEGYINAGIYLLDKETLLSKNLSKKFSFENDFFEKYINDIKISAYRSNNYFIDIGIPEDYEKAQIDLKRRKCLFLDRDGVINIDYGHVHKISDFKFKDGIFKLCKEYQDKGYIIVVVTNQAGISKKLYTKEDYFNLTKYMLEEFKKEGVTITKCYYCPHQDSDNCNCRKPKPGMLIDAIEELNIDVENSIMYGDKLSDLEAAYKVGVKKLYLVDSQYPKYDVEFKYILCNL